MSVEDYIGQMEHLTRQINAFSSAKRCYGDFIALLNQADIDNALEEDIATALAYGSWESREQYLKSFGDDEETYIYQVVERELEHVFAVGGSAEIVKRLAAVTKDKIKDPVFCAKHLAGRHLLNRILAVLYAELHQIQMEAELEIGDGRKYGLGGHAIQRLRELLNPGVKEHLRDKIRTLSGFFRFTSLEGAHGLFVPAYCELSVGSSKTPSPLDLVIATIADNPGVIASINPRNFEEVIARIFEEEGVRVELTAPTRDGGRDIICTSYKEDGSTRKTAIEVKRYTKQKVTFSKVTSFVGANIKECRDLIYVTSSSYTKPVEDYAEDMRQYPGIDSLKLKKLEDIVGWAREHKTDLLLPDAN